MEKKKIEIKKDKKKDIVTVLEGDITTVKEVKPKTKKVKEKPISEPLEVVETVSKPEKVKKEVKPKKEIKKTTAVKETVKPVLDEKVKPVIEDINDDNLFLVKNFKSTVFIGSDKLFAEILYSLDNDSTSAIKTVRTWYGNVSSYLNPYILIY